MTANPTMIQIWATRDKCWSCKHRFEKLVILPVKKIKPGIFQPNINVEVLVHVYDTHGIPPDILRNWIIGSIYDLELHEFGARGLQIADEL